MKLILIRGLPGSGKSTLARQLCQAEPGLLHLETDDFFIDAAGVYRHDPTRLAEAHQATCQKAANALQNGHSVVVANTFTQLWEMQPYVALAEHHQADLIIRTARGRHANIHDVPEEAIQRMAERWEPLAFPSNRETMNPPRP